MAKKAKAASGRSSAKKTRAKSVKKASASKGRTKATAKRRANGRRANGADRAPSRGRDPAAIALLKQDHRTVEALFEEFEEATSPTDKRNIAREICLELTIHTMIEEELFYPAVKDAIDEETYGEALVEHDGAKVLIAEIMDANPRDEFYDARVKVLSEMIKHHVKEEEQPGGMFAQARRGDIDFDDLGERLEQRKDDLKRTLKRSGIPAPETRTLHGAELRYGDPVG
ncbi:MAG TPA: hemerythrin domain-containing protein [Vitreimonas sp.]|uniref:hemerythrin domain-containing protein n=1 Tax=Vitreimonas sp. TaxID=3069702 RepID=UPI002D68FC3A|nr:hemerythrin domain-containing protein [Vitreimonas sp.]HYD87447.1 hemerythrin domain-containing protein [Vitreimonas sp.]